MIPRNQLFPPEERERRLRIIEAGVQDMFWKTLKDSMDTYCSVKDQEISELAADGREKEAKLLALEVRAIRRIMEEPSIIIKENKPLFDKFEVKMCQLCGHVVKKVKEIIQGVKS